jgi:hypothetical protein
VLLVVVGGALVDDLGQRGSRSARSGAAEAVLHLTDTSLKRGKLLRVLVDSLLPVDTRLGIGALVKELKVVDQLVVDLLVQVAQ